MINLASDETILSVMRRHWYVYAGPTAALIVLLILPAILAPRLPRWLPATGLVNFSPILEFATAIYLLLVLMVSFVVWMAYYLDAWVVTNRRVIDVQQKGLFWRMVSEIPLDRVENVTVETPGFIATLFGFSNMRIETAGEEDFVIDTVAGCEVARDLILEHSEHRAGLERPKQPAEGASP